MQYLGTYSSEKEYRADKTAYNYSLLKDFDSKSLLGFRKKYLLNDNSDEDGKVDMGFGRLAHSKMAENDEEFEENYYISSLSQKPQPQEVKFVDELFKLTLKYTDSNGIFNGNFGEICEEAYSLAKIKKPTLGSFLAKFSEGGLAEQYYQELRKSKDKQLVTLEDLQLCDKVINKGKNSPTVGEIINWKDRQNEIPIKFMYEGYTFRVLIDRLNFDHKNKTVDRIDWKFTYALDEKEFNYNYLEMKYYIQQFLYELGSRLYIQEMYPDYTINPFKYVAIDSKGLYDAVQHEFEFGWETPWTGFTHRGRKYRSIPEIIDTMEWHKLNNVWSMKKSTYLNKGSCKHIIGE